MFTREENPYVPDGSIRHTRDSACPIVQLHVVNAARTGINYKNKLVDMAFAQIVREIRPDVAHIGHLNHLSLGIVSELAALEIPIVYTLHDFWLMCLRGQFIQISDSNGEVWPMCDGQENKKCAERCMRRFAATDNDDVGKWENWVSERMIAVRHMAELVDIFIAPARSLAERYCRQFPIPAHKIEYLDYGFDRQRLSGRCRTESNVFVFGYIGTHIPGKGVHHLLEAFSRMTDKYDNCELHIWGRATTNTTYLKNISAGQHRIKWRGEYSNANIVSDVLNHVDAVVVPSIWEENSPLVIHEAQQARVPVITANMGGMKEYVRHEKNGLLFNPRCPASLASQMERFVSDPVYAKKIGARGYWYDEDGNVPDIGAHALAVENLYHRAVRARDAAKILLMPSPWRITFDTNPDHCNYHCTMCEEHSPYSPLQFQRRATGVAKRVMPFEMIEANVEEMAKKGLREIIPSTMGEPLLYKDFEKIIGLCERTGVMLNLTTNGSFPRLGVDRWARLLTPISSDIKISWNGACKKTHEEIMKNARWEDMLSNIRSFVAVRDAHAAGGGNYCRLTFQMTFMESNSAELPDIIRLAASLGVNRVKGHHLWAHFSEIENEDMRRDEGSIHRWNNIVAKSRDAADECRLPCGGRVLLDNIDFINDDVEFKETERCPFLGREAWISAEGRFNPCCAPDSERQTLGEFGNLNDKNLSEIWNGESYRHLIKTYRSRAVCQKCNMRKKI